MVKNLPANAGYARDMGFDPWVRKIPWSRKQQPTPVFLPGKFHGQKILVGYSPWGFSESDITEQLSIQHLQRICHMPNIKCYLYYSLILSSKIYSFYVYGPWCLL